MYFVNVLFLIKIYNIYPVNYLKARGGDQEVNL